MPIHAVDEQPQMEGHVGSSDGIGSHTIVSNLKDIKQSVASNIREFGVNLRNSMENRKYYRGQGATRHWSTQYDPTSFLKIRSVRKLLDVIEQKYSYVSITLLLIDMTLEATAFIIFLVVQHEARKNNMDSFDWGIGPFVVSSVLSLFFLLSWGALLFSAASKASYLCRPTSIMTYLSAVWMLVLALGALFTQSRWWTRVYAPMFLRVWWLHKCLLTLLDYPQLSTFFSVNKLEIIRSMVQCFAVICICVGTIQVVEMAAQDPVGYFDMWYMMIIAFSTIGYGDVTVSTLSGRLLMVIFVGIGISYFLPLLEYVANLGIQQLRFATYSSWVKRRKHIVLCGKFEYNDLRMHLDNLFASDRRYLSMGVVVLLPDQPSAEILLLVNSPKHRSVVTTLVGSPSMEHDLDRCNARGASAIFLFGDGPNSTYFSDYDVAKQAMCVSGHVPHTPLYALLHRSRYTKAVMPRGSHIVEFERLNHSLLGLGCVLPGMIPFVINLIRTFDPMSSVHLWSANDFKDPQSSARAVVKAVSQIGSKQRDMMTYNEFFVTEEDGTVVSLHGISDWHDLYEASLAQNIEVLPLPAAQRPRSFRSLVKLMYCHGIVVIGVVRRGIPPRVQPGTPAGFKTPSAFPSEYIVELAPRGDLSDVLKVVVICHKKEKAAALLNALPSVRAEEEMQGFEAADTILALKQHVQAFGSPVTAHTPRHYAPRNQAAKDVVIEEAGSVVSTTKLDNGREGAGAPPLHRDPAAAAEEEEDAVKASSPTMQGNKPPLSAYSEPLRRNTSPHEHSVLRFESDAFHLRDHFVYVDLSSAHERENWSEEARVEAQLAKAADFFDAMRPARQHSPSSEIVLLAREGDYDYLQMLWEDEMAGALTIVTGCGLFLADLQKCNFAAAAAVVVFSAGDRCDSHGDSLSILTSKTIQKLSREGKHPEAPDIPVVVELDHTKYISLLTGSQVADTEKSEADWVMEQSFLSGHVVCRHMFDTALQEAYFLPEIQQVLEQLLAGWQDSLSVTCVGVQAGWRQYSHVTDYFISRRLIPLAIHRLQEERSIHGCDSFRFIITNPPPSFPVQTDDVVYCLKIK